jgi:hypothetical protein
MDAVASGFVPVSRAERAAIRPGVSEDEVSGHVVMWGRRIVVARQNDAFTWVNFSQAVIAWRSNGFTVS